MQRSKIVRDHRSVLNTDAFDKRRFKELFEMSEGLQKVREEGQLPTTEALLGDIWAALYKMKPHILTEGIDPALKPKLTIMEKLMADEHFEEYRGFTRLDDLASTVCTVKFGEKINIWLAEAKALDEEFGLRSKGYTAIAVISLGYRSENDFNATLPKSRLSEEIIITKA